MTTFFFFSMLNFKLMSTLSYRLKIPINKKIVENETKDQTSSYPLPPLNKIFLITCLSPIIKLLKCKIYLVKNLTLASGL